MHIAILSWAVSKSADAIVSIEGLTFFSVLIVFTVLIAVERFIHQPASLQHLPITTDWLEEDLAVKYRPMMRLLGPEDLRFLKSQPGFTSQTATRFRTQRRRLFQTYLRSMDADFARMCMVFRTLVIPSGSDQLDLAFALLQHQMGFAYRRITVSFQAALYRYGILTANVGGLIKALERMRLELLRIVYFGDDMLVCPREGSAGFASLRQIDAPAYAVGGSKYICAGSGFSRIALRQ